MSLKINYKGGCRIVEMGGGGTISGVEWSVKIAFLLSKFYIFTLNLRECGKFRQLNICDKKRDKEF